MSVPFSFSFRAVVQLLEPVWGKPSLQARSLRPLWQNIFHVRDGARLQSFMSSPIFQTEDPETSPISFYLTDSASSQQKCLLMSTAVWQTSSIATRCPVWLLRWLSGIILSRSCQENSIVITHSWYLHPWSVMFSNEMCRTQWWSMYKIILLSYLWFLWFDLCPGWGQGKWNQDGHCQHDWCCKGTESASNM